MAGKTARKKVDASKARGAASKSSVAPEEAHAEKFATPEAAAPTEAITPDDAVPCTRSHIPNARTRKALRDADAGKNLTRYVDEDDLFRKLGITLGEEEAQGR